MRFRLLSGMIVASLIALGIPAGAQALHLPSPMTAVVDAASPSGGPAASTDHGSAA